jgi:hypothetical protein
MPFRPYEPFDPPCSGKAQPGTKNLSIVLLNRFDRSLSLGIYNCRPPSTHSDGRAFDLGFPDGVTGMLPPLVFNPHPQGFVALAVLRQHAWDLGITELIWNRVRYSAAHPNGFPYSGPSPHVDHIHVGQTMTAALTLTQERVDQILGGVMLTPEQEEALNELVAVRRQLRALNPPSNLSAVVAAVQLIRAWRRIDDVFDAIEV